MRVLFVIKQIDYEPQGILHLSSALKAAGHQVRLAIVAQEDVVAVAKEFQPGIVGYSVWTGGQHFYFDINRRIRAAVDVFSVFGGPHATFFPEMIEEDGVDGVCIGEGEGAMVDLANALEDGSFNPRIENWWFKLNSEHQNSSEHQDNSKHQNNSGHQNNSEYQNSSEHQDNSGHQNNSEHQNNGEIIRNPVRPYVADLDTLPLPDRALVYDKDEPMRRSKIKHFISSRGCPFDCAYCFNHALFEIYRGKGKRFRQRSVDNIIEEVNWVRENYPLQFVVFVDDMFVISRDWVAEFADKYPQAVGLPFFCNVRANLVSEELAVNLKRAGCVSVGMGVETGNDRLRNVILKRNMSKEQIVEACLTLRRAGLNVVTTNMVGLPTGTLEDDFETLRLNIESRPAFANAFIFQPYPRTELGDLAHREGLMEGTFDDIASSAWDTSVLKFLPQEKRQIENLQKLFAVTVEWPWLLPIVRHLIKLPRNRLFWLIHKLWKGYTIKNRVHPVSLSLREYITIVRQFMRLD